MTRKKKTTSHHKTHQVSDSNGWTHIIKGPKSNLPPLPSQTRVSPQKEVDSTQALDKVTFDFNTKHQPHWLQSQCCQKLTKLLREKISFPADVRMTKCVCLGLGSLNARYQSSNYQLAALITILEVLAENHNFKDVIFQDPAFTPIDIQFLESLKYTVVDDPAAFSLIDDATFVFAPHLECEFIAKALENARPALCITNDLDAYVSG